MNICQCFLVILRDFCLLLTVAGLNCLEENWSSKYNKIWFSLIDNCNDDQFSCGDGLCIPSLYHCNFGRQCPDGRDELTCGSDCDFESGLCGWINSAGLEIKWMAKQGPTDTSNTGPTNDHTYSNSTGTYYYMEASNRKKAGAVAHLESAMYVSSAQKCKLTFWYSMYGQEIGGMNAYVKTEEGEMKKVWSISGDQGQQWQQVGVPECLDKKYYACKCTYKVQSVKDVIDIKCKIIVIIIIL